MRGAWPIAARAKVDNPSLWGHAPGGGGLLPNSGEQTPMLANFRARSYP